MIPGLLASPLWGLVLAVEIGNTQDFHLAKQPKTPLNVHFNAYVSRSLSGFPGFGSHPALDLLACESINLPPTHISKFIKTLLFWAMLLLG